MSLSTVSATIQDPSGQVFANGTWQLIFKSTYGTPGLFTDGGVSFNTLYGGLLDATGSFSQAVNRNDTIAPANSHWTLVVSPNASGQSYSVDLNVNNAAFNASAAINAVITNILVPATPIAHAYKDSEVILTPNSGSQYYDNVNKVLKLWDTSLGAWQSLIPIGGSPTFNNITVTGQALVKNFENIRYADQFPGADYGIQIKNAIADLPVTGGIVDARAFTGGTTATNPFTVAPLGPVTVLLGSGIFNSSVQWVIAFDKISVIGSGMNQTILQYTGGAVASFIKISTATPSLTFIQQIALKDMTIRGSANVTDTLFISGVHHSTFASLSLRDCTGAALHTQFDVVNTYGDIHVSASEGSFVQQPTNGMLFDQIDAGHATTASNVNDPIIEGVSGSGIKLTGANGMTFDGGTSENNTGRGIEITNAANNFNNLIYSVDFENNTIEDILDNGADNIWMGILALKLTHVGASAKNSKFIGGQHNSITVDSGAVNAQFDTTWNQAGSGTIIDNGTDTRWIKLINKTSSVISPISASFGGGIGANGDGWTLRDTVPAHATSIGSVDRQDMLRGTFSFTSVASLISTSAIGIGPWRVLFIGAWMNNVEGGGLVMPAAITEVTTAAPSLTIGSVNITVSKNGSNQLQATTGANSAVFTGTIFVISDSIGVAGTSSAQFKGSIQTNLGTLGAVIASGTSVLTANATLAATTSQAAVTTAATGALTSDAIQWSYASIPGAGDSLCNISPYLTAGNVNFVRTNSTAAVQNVSALVINWRVIR